jgi:inositol phosphorylceramide mannosyltransferase catalytic subunit
MSPILARLRSRRVAIRLAVPVVVVVGALYLASRLLSFAQLFGKLGPHAGVEITQSQVVDAHNATDVRPQLIPKIVHHIFHNWKDPYDDEMPEDWRRMRQTCIDKNPDWDFRVRRCSCFLREHGQEINQTRSYGMFKTR